MHAKLSEARERIQTFRDAEGQKDPLGRSVFHRAQCAWALRIRGAEAGGRSYRYAVSTNVNTEKFQQSRGGPPNELSLPWTAGG